jgi:hypothetical protein
LIFIKKLHPKLYNKKIIPKGISRQLRSFLMIELMIALFLVVTCALPLARFPLMAAKQEFNSAYRMQAERLADLAFAKIQEQLHREEIPWKDILRTKANGATVLEDQITVAFDPLGKRSFSRLGTLHSVGKKKQNGEEWRLATFRVKIEPLQKGDKLFYGKKARARARIFTYQLLIHKTSATAVNPAAPVANS